MIRKTTTVTKENEKDGNLISETTEPNLNYNEPINLDKKMLDFKLGYAQYIY